MKVNKLPIFIKLFFTILGTISALLLPFLLFITTGEFKHSLSLYINDSRCISIFNVSLLIIAISLLVRRIYIIPSIFLILIICFDVKNFPIIHNACAGIFFILITFIILHSKKYVYCILMVLNALILSFFSFYIFELCAIFIVIAYNIEIMFLILKKEYNSLK